MSFTKKVASDAYFGGSAASCGSSDSAGGSCGSSCGGGCGGCGSGD